MLLINGGAICFCRSGLIGMDQEVLRSVRSDLFCSFCGRQSVKFTRKHWRKRPAGYKPDFPRYEKMKAQWIENNPKWTPEAYQDAMAEIARQCGI